MTRKFRVWLNKNVPGTKVVEIVIELDGVSSEDCAEACQAALETLIANELDTGWTEIS